jgi:hypothetical protein
MSTLGFINPTVGHKPSNDDFRPMHVSSRDSPQSLEFWEDGRQLGSEAVLELLPGGNFRAGGHSTRIRRSTAEDLTKDSLGNKLCPSRVTHLEVLSRGQPT